MGGEGDRGRRGGVEGGSREEGGIEGGGGIEGAGGGEGGQRREERMEGGVSKPRPHASSPNVALLPVHNGILTHQVLQSARFIQ